MNDALSWLAGLPAPALYAALAVTAAIENVFPPFPSDTVVAFGSFLAARGRASAGAAFLATWAGNVGGALAMYAAGRRLRGPTVERWLARFGGAHARERLTAMCDRRGLTALFVSRFLPGVRAAVPPFAGLARMPVLPVAVIIGAASALWYGAITAIAFRVGTDWDGLRSRIGHLSFWTAVAAVAVAVVAIVVVRRRRARAATP